MRFALPVLMLLFLTAQLSAEVVFLRNGDVLIGKITSAGSGTVTIQTFGDERKVPSKDILRSEPGLSDIKDLALQVILKDGTSIRGKLTDFDEEIGLFVDIGFGILALPITAIDKIVDPSVVVHYGGYRHILGVSGGVAFPPGGDYGLGYHGALTGELQLARLRELYALASFAWMDPGYTGDVGVSLQTWSLLVGIRYKFVAFGEIFPALEILTPYATLAAGGSLVTLFDTRAVALVDQRGLLTSSLAASVGLEWKLPASLSLRTEGGANFIFQTSGVFIAPKVSAGIFIGF